MKRGILLILTLLMCLMSSVVMAQDARPRLGLSVTTFDASPILLQHLKLAPGEGVMIRNVAVGGDLEAAGLSQGDILLAIDGHATNRPQDVTDYVSSLPKGTRVTLDVIQKGDHHQVYAVLDNLPDSVTWKYTEPGRRDMTRLRSSQSAPGAGSAPGLFGFPFGGFQGQIAIPNGGTGASHKMMFQSFMQTDQGLQQFTATIDGDPKDPESLIEITLDGNHYTAKVGELDKLPDAARDAAKQALAQSGNFSFSFSFGGGAMFDEMMKKQFDQMDQLEEMIFRNFFGNPGQRVNPGNGQQMQLQPSVPPSSNQGALKIEDLPNQNQS